MQQNKLYVGNLPFSFSETDLSEAFSQYGSIDEVRLITDRETGRSRGFGFVTFADQSAAESALQMNGKELGGRTVVVNIARERNERRGPGGGRRY